MMDMVEPDMAPETGPSGVLTADRFRTVAEGGLGHGDVAAHVMAWFQGRLYLGTSVPGIGGSETGAPEMGGSETARSPDRARILAHDPITGLWDTVFESPVLPLDLVTQARAQALAASLNPAMGGRQRARPTMAELSRDIAITSMIVFQGRSDPAPCLYCGTMSIWGGLILRSEDGATFAPVTEPGIDDDTQLSFHSLTALDGFLFAAPAGTVTEERLDHDTPPRAMVYVSDDPVSGHWTRAAEPGFGDPVNTGVFAMTTAQAYVYAGTGSPIHGFQLWRTDGTGAAPYLWERVLEKGAWRFNHNLTVAQMIQFGDDLYLGSGIAGFGYDRENDVGPAAAELLRVRKDGTWDLLVGAPRFTPDGLKVPLSAMGPGFDNYFNSVVWSMSVHDGILYISTHNWEPNHWAMDGQGQPIQGGYQLWASPDGEVWTRVLDDGNGKVTAVGIRTLCSTPAGFYVGTTNPARLIARQARRRSGLEIADSEITEGFDVLLAD